MSLRSVFFAVRVCVFGRAYLLSVFACVRARRPSMRAAGTVDFEQFCTAVLTFKTGSRADQARLIFKIIDVSEDKNLSKFEFLRFFCAGIKDKEKKRAMSDVVNELMRCLDKDGSGEVEHDEFVASVSEDEEVWILFDAISPFTNMKEKLSKFEFEQIDHAISP